MNNHPFDNKNPFTVPEGYFDNLQDNIMSRIRQEEQPKTETSVVRLRHYRTIAGVAACFALIFTVGLLFWQNIEQQPLIADSGIEDADIYQWLYESDKISLLAEAIETVSLINSESDNELWCTEEEEQEIILFLERDNLTVAAIVHSMADDSNIF